jgi:hypothetical protein
MSNHYSAANLRFPGDDARLDLTDLYVFQSPSDPGKTVLIMDVNPFTTGMGAMPPFLMKSEFHPDGVYRINIDSNEDALADASFTFVFSELSHGTQTATAYYATGEQALRGEPVGQALLSSAPVGFDASAQSVQAGTCRLFFGVRSDPFFADADGAFHSFNWTGQDAFADRNILSIALEVPAEMLGADPEIGVWAVVSVRRGGELVQVDRGGHPTINPFINPNDLKDGFNAGQPAEDLGRYLQPWSRLLEENGYTHEQAAAAARMVLPDILRYDRARPAAYPNGRALTDDVFSARMAWLTNGRVGPDGLKPHEDLLAEFPFLGPPNLYPAG